ncbi:MAG: hypothetical protein RMY28_015890 [Nostoc sp. ChiSLP01]|nr:hypothetical protein [Nostoc sp. CmiSLP01]MDZ8286060.1 hypothetical protein [Nostoc sp. ChiSLP01]
MKLQRIEAGEYLTPDGRFYIRNTYYSNGIPGRSNTNKGWLVEDKSGLAPFRNGYHKTNIKRVDTLSEAKEIIARIIECDRNEKTLRDAGWQKQENCQPPGICWRSPHTGRLLTRTEALLQLSLMS